MSNSNRNLLFFHWCMLHRKQLGHLLQQSNMLEVKCSIVLIDFWIMSFVFTLMYLFILKNVLYTITMF